MVKIKLHSILVYLLPVFISLLIIALMIPVNNLMLKIRFSELEVLLNSNNRNELQIDYLSVIGRYRLYRSLYRGDLDEYELPEEEIKSNLIYRMHDSTRDTSTPVVVRLLQKPLLGVINCARLVMGKSTLLGENNNEIDVVLNYAYYFERNRQYKRSVLLYDHLLDSMTLGDNDRAIVLFHKAFSVSIMGKIQEAEEILTGIINTHPGTEISYISAILLHYMRDNEKSREKVIAEASSLEKSTKLFYLDLFNDALAVLEEIKRTSPPSEQLHIEYLEARCYEEKGDIDSAFTIYRKIITENEASRFALMANRRIALIGVLSGNDKTFALASAYNKKVKDPDFSSFIYFADVHVVPGKISEDGLKYDISDKNGAILAKPFISPEILQQAFIEIESENKIEKKDRVSGNDTDIDKRAAAEEDSGAGYIDETVYLYDDAGRIIKKMRYDVFGDLEYYDVYHYHDNGNMKSVDHYKSDGTLLYYTVYEYKNNTDEIVLRRYDPDGNELLYVE